MADVLFSIKPKYANALLERKRFEFRRRLPSKLDGRVLIYASSPQCQIIGEVTIARILADTPAGLWQRTAFRGIDRASYDKYFMGTPVAYALQVNEARRYRSPVDPRKVCLKFRAPQSFAYLDSLEGPLVWAIEQAATGGFSAIVTWGAA
jgi:predicted transcriptional regulator